MGKVTSVFDLVADGIKAGREKLKAYHGSPHDFDEFSTEAIGTGEGAQAYGRGLYFAEREGTAKSYRDALTEPRFTFDGKPADAIYTNEIRERWADVYDELIDDDLVQDWKLSYLDSVAENGGDYEKASEALDSLVEKVLKGEETTYDFDRLDEFGSDVDPNGVYDLNEPQRHLDTVLANMSQADSPSTMDIVLSGLSPEELRIYERYVEPRVEYIKPEGKMYEVDIDASLDELLDYDTPIKDQPQNIQDAIYSSVEEIPQNVIDDYFGGSRENVISGDMTGNVFISNMEKATGNVDGGEHALMQRGVKGIKYADAQTRFSPKGKTHNYVIFDDKLIQIARKYGVTLPVAGAILAGTMTPEQAQAGFYSQAVKAAQNLTRKTGNAQGFKNDLTGKGQVKPDELKAMGFDEHFGNRTDITKEEVQQFINDNQVQIKETVLGKPLEDRYVVRPDPEGGFNVYDATDPSNEVLDSYGRQETAISAASTMNKNENVDTSKFGKWTLDEGESGENYRELLMTLPRKAHSDQGKLDELLEMQKKEDYLSDLDTHREKLISEYQTVETELVDLSWSEMGDLTGDKLEKAKQLRRQQETINSKLRELSDTRDQRKMDLREQIVDLQHEIHQEKRGQEFINSGHFDEPNILAHLRMKDRVDADGNKTLLLEEVQSDWHQTGANQGYKGGSEAISEATRKVNEAKIASDKAEQELADYFKRNGLDMESEVFDTDLYLNLLETDEASKIMDSQADAMSNVDAANRNLVAAEKAAKTGVPDAPFKTDDKSSWYNLAMKRGLIEAAEGDYDKLAFTTGRQQAERYDLSKTIGSLKYQEDMVEGRPVNILTAYDKHGMRVFNRRIDDPEKELPSIIGKDATKSLLEAEPYTPPQETRSIRSLRGQELNVGGEGMKEFYDRKLPNTLNKLVKQDGVKVGQTELAHPSSGTELNRDGFTRQEVAEIERLQDLVDRDYASSIDREYLANYLAREKPYGDIVHSIDITPEMRQRVKKGLPLFTTAAGVPILNNMFAPKVQAAEYNEAPVIEEQSFGDMVNEYGQINRNLKALEQQKFDRLMAEDKKLRAMGSASFGKVSPELAAYRRSRLLPSLGNMAVGAVDESLNTLDFLSNLPRAVATMQWNPTSPLQDRYGEAVRSVVFGDERDKGALDEERFVGGFLGL